LFLVRNALPEIPGVALYKYKGAPVQILVNSRIMVDPGIFRELHLGYSRPRVYEPSHIAADLFDLGKPVDHIKESEIDAKEIQDRDLLICNLTIPGWILSDKTWSKTLHGNLLIISNQHPHPAHPRH
jgi:hypothetical protein